MNVYETVIFCVQGDVAESSFIISKTGELGFTYFWELNSIIATTKTNSEMNVDAISFNKQCTNPDLIPENVDPSFLEICVLLAAETIQQI